VPRVTCESLVEGGEGSFSVKDQEIKKRRKITPAISYQNNIRVKSGIGNGRLLRAKI